MKKQYSKVIKIVIQILFFLWIPESFAASLYAVKKLIHAVSVMDFTYAREPVLLLLETVVTTAVFGRYYCGYICSFGAAQDLSYDLGNLIRKQTKYRKKRMLSVKTDKILSKLKYPVLVIVAVSAVWKKNQPLEGICQSAVHAERKFQQRESDFCRCLDLYHCSGHIGSIFQSVLQISVSDGSNLYTAFLFLFGQKKAKLQKQRRLFNLSVSVQTAEK